MSGKAFDSYAKTYDADFTDTGIGKAQRARVWNYLRQELNKHQSVLEINCGTGTDAFEFASKVKFWRATDASEEMIGVCKTKLSHHPQSNLSFEIKDALAISDSGFKNNDVLFSNFAGLNCLSPDQLLAFAKQSSNVINSKGKLVLVFLGKKCVWENLYFLIKRDVRFRRRQMLGGVPTEIEGRRFQTHYYSPREIASTFSHYQVTRLVGIGLFIPPSFMIRHFPEKSWALKLLKGLESLASSFKRLANYADHFYIVLEKKD